MYYIMCIFINTVAKIMDQNLIKPFKFNDLLNCNLGSKYVLLAHLK